MQALPAEIQPAQSSDTARAIKAWNLMGGLDWAALPVVCELLGIADPEPLIYQLQALRNQQRQD